MEGDKSMIIKQLDVSIEKQAQEEYQASQVQISDIPSSHNQMTHILLILTSMHRKSHR